MCYFGLFLSKLGCHGNSFGSLDILDSIFEFADPENLTMHAKSPRFLLPITAIGAILTFLPKFSCQGNSVGSLEILDCMFVFDDPEKPIIHAKIVSISCTEMKFAYMNVWRIFTIAGVDNFLVFLREIVEIVKIF